MQNKVLQILESDKKENRDVGGPHMVVRAESRETPLVITVGLWLFQKLA